MLRKMVAVCLALSACTPTAVTGYNGKSIRIQSGSPQITTDVLAEAQRICATEGLQAEYASTRSFPSDYFTYNHLFLCLTHAKPNAGLARPITGSSNYLEDTSTL